MTTSADVCAWNVSCAGAALSLWTGWAGFLIAAMGVSAVLVLGSDLWEMVK